jgi:hypothetical protein
LEFCTDADDADGCASYVFVAGSPLPNAGLPSSSRALGGPIAQPPGAVANFQMPPGNT